MEATCQYESMEDESRVLTVCGAPIPRLDEGPCAVCEYGRDQHDTITGLCPLRPGTALDLLTTYLGPLASKCTAGHPVAVPTEAERRG